MENSIFHRLSSLLWGVIVTLMVLLAVYVSAGRMLMANLTTFQDRILLELNSHVPFTIEADRVGGEWHSFTPVIVLNGLRLGVAGSARPPIELDSGRVAVDVLNSLRSGSLQLTRVMLDGLHLRAELTPEGQFRIRGFDGGTEIAEWLREFVLNVEFVGLRDNQLQLTLPSGDVRNLDFSLDLNRDGSYRRLAAELISDGGTSIHTLAEGVGNPFTPKLFSGEMYLDVESGNLGAVEDMLANGPLRAWSEGELDLELWFSWSRGEPSLEARAEARDLLIADREQSWQVPLDRVALEARLVERKNRWTLYASDLELEKAGAVAHFPKLQLDLWSEALRIRSSEVELEPLATIAESISGRAEVVADVFEALQPAGLLSSLELSIGDRAAPLANWAVEANFEELAVSSWKGAPGLKSATGYVEIDQDGGFVIIDSRQLAMDFPTIYREPLRYDDFYGTINIDWDAEALRLGSGLISAQGDEGDVRAFFALNIPLVKNAIGLEMELLVGLHDAHPTHRVKYVPYLLNKGLSDWLDDSIGDGQVDEGAFIWRGTLSRKTGHLRTVQLAFNVSDTSLNYHPRWPPVTVQQGIIYIDDSNVSVWANNATLFESEVERLSVESWVNPARQVELALDGTVWGPASDGMAILNDSPINDIVNGAFADWTLEGHLRTDLHLNLNLTDRESAPRVEVVTRWRDVDLDIHPGNLPVRGINGEFSYSTGGGFSSSGLDGTLWGQPLSADVAQLAPRSAGGRSPVSVSVATTAVMAELGKWLNMDSLALAKGKTPVGINVRVTPGKTPLLNVTSTLEGVSLDLPEPWRKPAAGKRRFSLASPLAGGGNRLTMELEGGLKLYLHVADGKLLAGSLGINQDLGEPEPGVLRIGGRAPLVDVDEWSQFLSRYFSLDTGSIVASNANVAMPAAADPEGKGADAALSIKINELLVDALVIRDQTISDAAVSVAIGGERWYLAAETDWFRGDFVRYSGKDISLLTIERLDLAGMEQLNPAEADAAADADAEVLAEADNDADDAAGGQSRTPLEFPDMLVVLEELRRGDFLLGQLNFQLSNSDGSLLAENINGQLAGMQMPEESPGKLVWRQADAEGRPGLTQLQSRLAFADLGQVLGKFGYEKIVETEDGWFDLDLSWPGSPQDFSLQEGQGQVRVSIGEGRFLEAPSGASGALKVANILNLADIVRRLSLSHMFESGIPFDSVEGEVFLHGGAIEVAGIDVKGPSSFYFSGVSDVSEQTLDGELVATLPMANNLPWVVALTASLPLAAGVYVMSKLFQKQVNRLSSAVYSITGSWDDPAIDFEHIFDDTAQRTQSLLPAQGSAGLDTLPQNAAELPPVSLLPQDLPLSGDASLPAAGEPSAESRDTPSAGESRSTDDNQRSAGELPPASLAPDQSSGS